MLIIPGMLGDIFWGAVAPLVYCGCMSLDPECFLVCCYSLDDEEVISIIYLLGTDSLQ